MAVIFTDLDPQIQDPLDSRIVQADASARLAIGTAIAYEGLVVYQEDNNTLYVLTDASDPSDTSNWEEVGSGGGGGGTNVVAYTSVQDSSDDDLAALRVGNTTYNIPSGGGNGDANNSTITLNAGAGLDINSGATDSFTLNQSSGESFTFDVDSTVVRTTTAQGIAGVKSFSDAPVMDGVLIDKVSDTNLFHVRGVETGTDSTTFPPILTFQSDKDDTIFEITGNRKTGDDTYVERGAIKLYRESGGDTFFDFHVWDGNDEVAFRVGHPTGGAATITSLVNHDFNAGIDVTGQANMLSNLSVSGSTIFTGSITANDTASFNGQVSISDVDENNEVQIISTENEGDFGNIRIRFLQSPDLGADFAAGYLSSADLYLHSSASPDNENKRPCVAAETTAFLRDSDDSDEWVHAFSFEYKGEVGTENNIEDGGGMFLQARGSSTQAFSQILMQTRHNADPTTKLTIGSQELTSNVKHNFDVGIDVTGNIEGSGTITGVTDITASGNGSFGGTLGVTGNATFDGNMTLGESSTDVIEVDGTFYADEQAHFRHTGAGAFTVDGQARFTSEVVFGASDDDIEINNFRDAGNSGILFARGVIETGWNVAGGLNFSNTLFTGEDFGDWASTGEDARKDYIVTGLRGASAINLNSDNGWIMSTTEELIRTKTEGSDTVGEVERNTEIYGRRSDTDTNTGDVLHKTQLKQNATEVSISYNTDNNTDFVDGDKLINVASDQIDIYGHLDLIRTGASVLETFNDTEYTSNGSHDMAIMRFTGNAFDAGDSNSNTKHTYAEITAHALNVEEDNYDAVVRILTGVDGGSLSSRLSIDGNRITNHVRTRFHGSSSNLSNGAAGDVYYNTGDLALKLYHGSDWYEISNNGTPFYLYTSPGAPSGTYTEGRMYWDSQDNQLMVHDGSSFINVGGSGGGSDLEVYEGSTEETSAATRLTFNDDDFNLTVDNNQVTINAASQSTFNGTLASASIPVFRTDNTAATIATDMLIGRMVYRADNAADENIDWVRLNGMTGGSVADGDEYGRFQLQLAHNGAANNDDYWDAIDITAGSDDDDATVTFAEADVVSFDLANNGTFRVRDNADNTVFSVVESSDTSITTTLNRQNGDTLAVNGATQFNHDVFVGATDDSDPDLTVYGSTTLNGNVTLGNSNTDTVTVNADVTSASTSDWVLQGDVTMRGAATRIGNTAVSTMSDAVDADELYLHQSVLRGDQLNTYCTDEFEFIHFHNEGTDSQNNGEVIYSEKFRQTWSQGGLGISVSVYDDIAIRNIEIEQDDDADIIANRIKTYTGSRGTENEDNFTKRTRFTQDKDGISLAVTSTERSNLYNSANEDDFDDAIIMEASDGPSYFTNNWNEIVVGGTKLADMPNQTETIDGTEHTRKVVRYRRRGVTFYRVFRDKTNDTASTFGYNVGGTDYLANEWIYFYTGSSTDDQTISNDLASASNRRDVDYRG